MKPSPPKIYHNVNCEYGNLLPSLGPRFAEDKYVLGVSIQCTAKTYVVTTQYVTSIFYFFYRECTTYVKRNIMTINKSHFTFYTTAFSRCYVSNTFGSCGSFPSVTFLRK